MPMVGHESYFQVVIWEYGKNEGKKKKIPMLQIKTVGVVTGGFNRRKRRIPRAGLQGGIKSR